ncbi:MAG: AP2 domain-containing protein [Saprospiraceae bacterium]|nr:AP2 domain-containing protein [Saprospiraceae bacterium]MDW8228592.1 AP2 domain-containing protein [Saprospiraceae bacterium]
MTYKIKLKNSNEFVLLDDFVYEWLSTDPYFVELNFLNHLRLHSSGCAVFQKNWRKLKGGYKTETIYLHKLIADKYLGHQKTPEASWVGALNGNKLDCRVENLFFHSRSSAGRRRKAQSRSGYIGVYLDNKRYRAVISVDGKPVHLGMFDTAEEAAAAYRRAQRELLHKDDESRKE